MCLLISAFPTILREKLHSCSVQLLSRVWFFAFPWIAACQASLFITNSRSSPKLMCIELVMPSSHLLLTHVIHYYIQVPTGSVVSDSVRSHRWQPTRLPHPWDSPGKNTGVACHFLLQCVKVKSEREVAQSCPTPSDPMDCSPPGSSVHGIFQARVLAWLAIAFSVFTCKIY